MAKVWNRRDPNTPADAVYVGRPTKWGNPFVIGKDGSREDVIQQYRDFVLTDDLFMDAKEELAGKDLVCWCAPKPCHADILLEIANR